MDQKSTQPEPADVRRQQVINTALKLCRERGYDQLTLGAICAASGVPAEEIGQWWPSVSALVIDAFRAEIGPKLSYEFTGDFAADLRAQLVAIARLFAAADFAPHLAALVAHAQRDADVAAAFIRRVYGPNRAAALARFEEARDAGQLRSDIDLAIAVDLAFAPLWFRLLLSTGEITVAYAEEIARLALAGLGT
jgi:AcrR family transcriptional regulator